MDTRLLWWIVGGGIWCITCLVFTFWPKRCNYCHGTGRNLFHTDKVCSICEGKKYSLL